MNIQPKSIVTVFVRHLETRSYRSRGEFYRGCQCSKFLRYSRTGKQHRQAAKTRTWAVAEDKAVELQEQLDRGDTPKPIIVKGAQPTIAECIDTFISAKKSENISARRVKKLRHRFNQFEAFMSARSKGFPSLITSADVIEFRAGWERAWPSATTRQNAQPNIRSFLRKCCRENLNDLLAALKTIRLSKADKERLEPKPFTEKDLVRPNVVTQGGLEFQRCSFSVLDATNKTVRRDLFFHGSESIFIEAHHTLMTRSQLFDFDTLGFQLLLELEELLCRGSLDASIPQLS